jgi:serine phosphatase RsbU (regulator of sigma subunit)
MKALVISGVFADIFVMLVLLDLIVHHGDNERKAFIKRVLKARKQMEDEYLIVSPEPTDDKNHQGVVHPRRKRRELAEPHVNRKLREQKNQEHEAWIADLTNERDLYDLYSSETVLIPLPAHEDAS